MRYVKQLAENIWDVQPGNGSRYKIVICRLLEPDPSGKQEYLASWLKYGDVAGPSMIFRTGHEYDAGYVADKLNILVGDAVPFLIFLNRQVGVKLYMPAGYNADGVWMGLENDT